MSDSLIPHQMIIPGPRIGPNDKVTPGTRLKMSIEVTAGLYPGHIIDEFTRRWLLTSEAWEITEGPDNGGDTFNRFCDEAFACGRSLCDPRLANHVAVNFLWM